MKMSISKLAGGLTLMAVSSVAMASVVNTPHNLSITNTSGGQHLVGPTATTEICIFCHTPHGGDQSVAAPIWNRTVSSTSVYTRFSSMGRITFDAKEAPVGAVSIACLSCHDGSQARDAVINGPGSGQNNNSVLVGGGSGPGSGTWVDGTNASTAYLSNLNASDNGRLDGDLIYLGTDLRNDHPISMQYGGGGISFNSPTGPTIDPDFSQSVNSAASPGGYGSLAANHASPNTTAGTQAGIATGSVNYSANYGSNAIGPKWWVDTGTAGYQATDFPLYTRTDLVGDPTPQPFVECATCHDPHSQNSTFLRLPGGNTRSQVCLTCHAK